MNNISKGKANAFHLLLKYAPPNMAIAPTGEKLASGEMSELKLKTILSAATVEMKINSMVVRGLKFLDISFIFSGLKFETYSTVSGKALHIVAVHFLIIFIVCQIFGVNKNDKLIV